jgi:hypothetical protein
LDCSELNCHINQLVNPYVPKKEAGEKRYFGKEHQFGNQPRAKRTVIEEEGPIIGDTRTPTPPFKDNICC